MEDIHTAEENIQKILDATNVISDNITHLSATGEEVAASSTEGLRMADSTVLGWELDKLLTMTLDAMKATEDEIKAE